MNSVIEDLKKNGLYQNTTDTEQIDPEASTSSISISDDSKRGRCPKCIEDLDVSSAKASERHKARSKSWTSHRCAFCKSFVCSKHSNITCTKCHPNI